MGSKGIFYFPLGLGKIDCSSSIARPHMQEGRQTVARESLGGDGRAKADDNGW